MKAFRWTALAGLAALLVSGCGSSNSQQQVFFLPTPAPAAHGTLTAAATQNESAGITNSVGGSVVVADPASDRVYLLGVNAASTASNLAGFTLDPVTGTLTLLSGSPFANSGPDPRALAINPNGNFLYVPNQNDDKVAVQAVNGQGQLAELNTSPFLTAVDIPRFMAVNPAGTLGYVLGDAENGNAQALMLNVNGSLTTLGGAQTARSFDSQDNADAGVFDATGAFFYTANFESGLNGFSVNTTTGVLTPLSGSPFGGGPTGSNIVRSGPFLYLANATGGIEAFKIGSQGAVTAISGIPTLTTLSGAIATEPSGRALYAQGSDGVHVFAIDQSSGALTEIAGSPFSDGIDPRNLVVDRTGTVLIVGSSTGSANTGTLTTVSTFHIAP